MDRTETISQAYEQPTFFSKQELQVKSEIPFSSETPLQDHGWDVEAKFVEVKLRPPPADEISVEASEPTDILQGTEQLMSLTVQVMQSAEKVKDQVNQAMSQIQGKLNLIIKTYQQRMLLISKQLEMCTVAERKTSVFQMNLEKQMHEAKGVLGEIKLEIT